MKPKALILFAHGTNRDGDIARALELAGADPTIVPLNDLREKRVDWLDFQLLVLPGGFSFADALGAGKLLALDLSQYFLDEAATFVAAGKPVLGVCNGFQVLVKAGFLPGSQAKGEARFSTLTYNQGNHFECRWVTLKPLSQTCLWTKDLESLIDCPVAHGEGNFQTLEPSQAQSLFSHDQVALIYTYADGQPADGKYPLNPNGSLFDIAGVCNKAGNVLGLMPHPEDHVFPYQAPDRSRRSGFTGLPLFENGVRFAAGL